VTRRLTPEEAAAALASAEPIPAGRAPARAVRRAFHGEDPEGRHTAVEIDEPTLVVFLSTTCDGCRDLADLVRDDALPIAVLGVLRAPAGEVTAAAIRAFTGASRRWLLGDDPFDALEVRGGPYFCLLDGRGTVVVEGVAFGRAHVEAHVATALDGRPAPDAVRLRPDGP
jgi:hypothetical protein